MTAAVPEPELPEVSTSTAGTVVVELSPDDAEALARILARFDVIAGWHGPDGERIPVGEGYTAEIWHHTLIRLLAESQNARLQVSAPTVLVPFRRPTPGAR